jgi:uncharacterized protein with PIN domain
MPIGGLDIFLTKSSDNERYEVESVKNMTRLTIPVDEQRCPTCRTKIVVPSEEGLVIKNAILRVNAASGQASAKCPRCKTWVDVPLTYRV